MGCVGSESREVGFLKVDPRPRLLEAHHLIAFFPSPLRHLVLRWFIIVWREEFLRPDARGLRGFRSDRRLAAPLVVLSWNSVKLHHTLLDHILEMLEVLGLRSAARFFRMCLNRTERNNYWPTNVDFGMPWTSLTSG